mgnify:CR=1 FL=1
MNYLLDPKIVESLLEKPIELNGKSFHYTNEELDHIKQEANRLFNEFTAGKTPRPENERRYFITAGGPGSGKSTLVEQLIEVDPVMKNAVYVDPDETIMRNMPAFKKDVSKNGVEDAYSKWRWASQYIWHSIRNRAAQEGYDIINGTTATSDLVNLEYENVLKAGYKPVTIAVCASEQVRRESVQKRYDVTGERYVPEEDIKNKGAAFFDKIPLYIRYSSAVHFYHRDEMSKDAELALTSVKGRANERGKAYEKFIAELVDNGVEVQALFDIPRRKPHTKLGL